jgi:hypothetical protein
MLPNVAPNGRVTTKATQNSSTREIIVASIPVLLFPIARNVNGRACRSRMEKRQFGNYCGSRKCVTSKTNRDCPPEPWCG